MKIGHQDEHGYCWTYMGPSAARPQKRLPLSPPHVQPWLLVLVGQDGQALWLPLMWDTDLTHHADSCQIAFR